VQVTLLPARADSGIVFVRTDCAHPLEIAARPAAVTSTERATTLGRGGVTIGTVEHLLAALYGLGIDNVRIEVDGGELPVMDGSAASFVYLIRSAGVFEQREPRCALRLRRPIEVVDGDRRISLAPSRTFQVTYVVDFDHPAIGRQEYRLGSFDPDGFERDLSAARTFGFLNDAEALWSSGLLGVPIQGHVRVERGGHSLHQRLLAALLENPDAWWIHDPDPASMAPIHLIPAERAA
jgi:UDP-3-O-[3-hydroxymyristoyl] N-acetylglucosamine deacetylase